MARNSVGWFEIYVDDMERAKSFYNAVLDVKLESLESSGIEMWTFPGDPNNPGAAGSLVHMDGFKAGGNSTLVYFSCEDVANEESRVETNGGKVFKTKFSIGQYGFIALAYDTEGNMFGLHSLN
ncbi:MAG: VOC family protein [Pyrinomonadaceae bacterium]